MLMTWRVMIGVALILIIYFGGLVVGDHRARIRALESWQAEVRSLANSRDLRIRALEADMPEVKRKIEAIEQIEIEPEQ